MGDGRGSGARRGNTATLHPGTVSSHDDHLRRCPMFRFRPHLVMLTALAVSALLVPPGGASAADPPVRFATFNASLNRNNAGQALAQLSAPGNVQADRVAEIIQRMRPEILLINEFDFEPNNALAEAFQDNYLAHEHSAGGPATAPIDYPYVFVAPSNTGIPSGFDLNNNGAVS